MNTGTEPVEKTDRGPTRPKPLRSLDFRPRLQRRCVTPVSDSRAPRTLGCPPGPISTPVPRRTGKSGPATRTWLQLQGAGRRRADTPELLGRRFGLGCRVKAIRTQPSPERLPYRAASALPARGKGATGFPGRTSRASGLARSPRARENRVRKGGSAYLRANGLRFRRGGRVCSEGVGRQKKKLGGRA